jgi:hypothetical protein
MNQFRRLFAGGSREDLALVEEAGGLANSLASLDLGFLRFAASASFSFYFCSRLRSVSFRFIAQASLLFASCL